MPFRKRLSRFWAMGIFMTLPYCSVHAQCSDVEPEQATEQMMASYPHDWKTYRNLLYGFSVRIPPQWIVEKNADNDGIHFHIDWCGGEPGSSAPFSASVRVFDAFAYKPSRPEAAYPPTEKTLYLKPDVSEIHCGQLRARQETFKDAAGEMSTSVLHRIALQHGRKIHEWNFSYVISGIVSGTWAGSDSADARKEVAEEKKFIADNEDLECRILSTLAFTGN